MLKYLYILLFRGRKVNNCKLCPVGCGANRQDGVGYCGQSEKMKIAKYYLHTFEEPPLSGKNGSGTVFFCGCSLKCVFCQNYALSRSQTGKEISPNELAEIFKELENMGAHNINLVTPAHFVPQIVEAFKLYRPKVPVVYNTHAYEKIETLKLIDLYVDIYLPDLKFYSPELSKRYTGKDDYFQVASRAISFMMNSKKTVFGEDGLLKQGVIVRHMIMPLGVKDSKQILNWFNGNKKNGAYLSLMGQYTPFGEKHLYPELKRKITAREYERVYEHLLSLGITEYFVQELGSASESFIPKWDF
ncbi:MAG: radical SAM protein [Clostridiales bacterium]|nr:radical SAM protein [Clostridiales bacterium]